MHGIHAATSKVENSAQGSSCKLKFVHGPCHYDECRDLSIVMLIFAAPKISLRKVEKRICAEVSFVGHLSLT